MPRFRPGALRRLACALAALCIVSGVSAQTSVSIHDIMTKLPNSPLLGQNVTTNGIVVGVISSSTAGANGGFYISLKTYDSDMNTAEGIFVAGSGIAGCQVSVGQVASVTGIVTNSTLPNLTAANTPGTYLVPSACSTSGTDATSATINLSQVLTTFGDALKYTGMSIANTSFYAVQPTTGTIASNAGSVTSTGQFWATLNSNTSTNNHLFRSAGIAGDEYKPSTAPGGVPTWSGNPQRVLIDTTSFGGSPVDITVGQTITCSNRNTAGIGALTGIGLVDYTLGYARVMIFKSVTCAVSGSIATSVSAAADITHFKVGTLDVNTFLGSASIFQTALAKATLTVKNVFGSPDIFAMQEVGSQATLQVLADSVNSANSGSTNYTATVLGTDTINSGFLVNTNTLKNTDFKEVGRGATYTTSSGTTAVLWEHPPLVLTGEFVRVGRNYPVTVINVHLTPRDNSGDATFGADVRAHRAAQAAAVSALAQQYQSAGANVIVAGNFNSYEYNDGYVDVVGVIDGAPAAATAVTTYQATATTAPLTDFTTQVTPANTRYNIIESGNAASLEHILASSTVTNSATASASLASYGNTVTQPHFSTDYSAVSANDATTPAGLTPHDGFLVNFAIPPVPTTATLVPDTLNFGDVSVTDSKTLALTFTDTSSFSPATINVTNIAIGGTNAGDFTQTSNCLAVTQGQSCTINVTFAPSAPGTRTGTITVTSDSTSNPTLTASLTGNGVDTSASLSPTSATFPNTYAGGGVSPSQTFTVTNTSLIAIKVLSATTTANFKVTANNCSTLAVGGSCTVLVAFAPTASGALTGTLTVATNTSANPTLTATLNGNGLPTTATLTPASQAFGNIVLGESSAALAFTYTNTSAIALTVTGATTTGDYRVVGNGCSTLAANASCVVTVAFAPTALGSRTGTLTVASSASANPTLTSALTGRGVADVEADVALLSFGNIDVGATSAPQAITITNYTSTAIGLTGITLSGADYADTTSCGAVLGGKSSCTITVVFTPTAVGVRTGILSMTTSDTKYPLITVALTGNGVDFALSMLPTSGNQIAGNGTVSVALTATPLGGFNAAISLTCTFQAVASTCTLPNTGFVLSGTTTQNLAITTTGQYTLVGYGFAGKPRGLGLLGFLLVTYAATMLRSNRRRYQTPAKLLLAVCALLLASTGLTGCSGKIPDQNSPYTEPGTYTYTVTGTDGFLKHTATYTLTVRQR